MAEDFDYQSMLAGELYLASDISAHHQSTKGKMLQQKINQTPFDQPETIVALEAELFGQFGKHGFVQPPLYVDYGRHVEIGEHFYANMDCLFLDVNRIIIGDHVMVGPRVSFYTAGHPIDAAIRSQELEFGLPIIVKDHVWIGGNSTILPDVTIGARSIVAAGSVVTKDVPEDCIVGGNPARVIRKINDKDQHDWQEAAKQYREKKSRALGAAHPIIKE